MNNKGFTMLEVIVSLFLLSMFILLMSNIVNLTAKVSKTFLDYSDYEYALMHKKIFEMYDDALEVAINRNKLEFKNEKEGIIHKVIFTNNKIYKQTKNADKNFASGYTLMLENIESYSISAYDDNDNLVDINIVDREKKKRHLILKLKNQISDNHKEDSQDKLSDKDKKDELLGSDNLKEE